MIRDYKTKRIVDIRERMLVIRDRVYTKDSYVAFDTSSLKGYPPRVYYDREDIFLGKMYDDDLYELDDIEDVLLLYQDQCFSNHDLDDLREVLCKRREKFLQKVFKKWKNY